jgi:hypothetical protein
MAIDKSRKYIQREQKYNQARRIGSSKLSDLIARNIQEGDGVFESVGRSISQKVRAKGTRIKAAFDFREAFDPLNIASMMVGRSRLGTAVLGKMMGRSGDDMQYFANKGKKGKRAASNYDPFYSRVSAGSITPVRQNDSIGNVFAKIYNLMKKNSDDKIRRKDIENNFKEELDLEDERRHKELLKAIGTAGGGTVTQETATKVSDDKGIFGKIQDMFGQLMQTLKPFIEVAKAITVAFGSAFLKIISALGAFLLSPLGLGLLGLAGGITLTAYLAAEAAKAISEFEKNRLQEKGGDKAVAAQKELLAAPPAPGTEDGTYNEFGGTALSPEAEIAAEKRDAAIKEKQTLVWQKMTAKGYPVRNTGIFGGVTYEKKSGEEAPKELVIQMGKEADVEIAKKPKQMAPSKPSVKPMPKSSASPASSAATPTVSPTAAPAETPKITPIPASKATPAPAKTTPPPVVSAIEKNVSLQNNSMPLALPDGNTMVVNKTNTVPVSSGRGDTGTITGAAPVRDDAIGDFLESIQKRASVM